MINESVIVFKGAIIDGKVNIDNKSSVWFNAVLRGDIEPLRLVNVQMFKIIVFYIHLKVIL